MSTDDVTRWVILTMCLVILFGAIVTNRVFARVTNWLEYHDAQINDLRRLLTRPEVKIEYVYEEPILLTLAPVEERS